MWFTSDSSDREPLAITGMACRLPGIPDTGAYWHAIRSGRVTIGATPPDRLDPALYFSDSDVVPGLSYSRVSGAIPYGLLHGSAIDVDEQVVALSDPLHLGFLDVATRALVDAGLNPRVLPTPKIGVYVAHSRGSRIAGDSSLAAIVRDLTKVIQSVASFQELPADVRQSVIDCLVSRVDTRKAGDGELLDPHEIAMKVSDTLHLSGPAMAINAACASSFFALNAAAMAIHSGQVDTAIVGGASSCDWTSLVLYSWASALSRRGVSRPFDQLADGFVASEGLAALVVKSLSKALADGDPIHAVVRGIGISSDGRGKGLWAPSPAGQTLAISRAYGGHIDKLHVQHVEAHGTSTAVGDSTEIRSLNDAFAGVFLDGKRVPITSSKANVGHTREAAGLVGLIKTVLAMRAGVIPKATSFDAPTSEVDWEATPFFVPRDECLWEPGPLGLRRGSINSFGIGGLNAHVVLDDTWLEENPSHLRKRSKGRGRDGVGAVTSVDPRRIEIAGVGVVLPGGVSTEGFSEFLRGSTSALRDVPHSRRSVLDGLGEALGGAAEGSVSGGIVSGFSFDWKRHRVAPRELERADPLQYMVLEGACRAWDAAHRAGYRLDPATTCVVVGTVFGGDFASRLAIALRIPELAQTLSIGLQQAGCDLTACDSTVDAVVRALAPLRTPLSDETGSYISSALASRVLKALDLRGGGFAVDAGDTSSLAAIDLARQLIQCEHTEAVICVGAQRSLGIPSTLANGFHGTIRNAGSAGAAHGSTGPAEGVGALVLASDRLRTNASSRPSVIAVTVNLSERSHKAVVTNVEGLVHSAGTPAFVDIGLSPTLSALRTPIGEALIRRSDEARYTPRVSWVADRTGHAMGASGIISALAALAALEDGDLSPKSPRLQRASAVSVDSSGLAYCVVLESPTAHFLARDRPEPTRLTLIGATTKADLIELIHAYSPDPHALPEHPGKPPSSNAVRLAVVNNGHLDLVRKLQTVSTLLQRDGAIHSIEDQGVYLGEGLPAAQRLAFMFSGQGSQYPGMLRPLIQGHPAASAACQRADEAMIRLGFPTFAEIAWDSEELGQDPWLTQASILLADTILHAVLSSVGVSPSVLSGHSFGEYAALVAAESWSLDTAVRVTRRRCDLMGGLNIAGGMLATDAPADVIHSLIDRRDGPLYVANYNAPLQTILGGLDGPVSVAAERLAQMGHSARRLPVPLPYHTPLLAGIREPFAQFLADEHLRPPKTTFLSSITNRYVAEPEDIRQNLVAQLTVPVQYPDLVRKLRRDGVTVFVEVGPKQVLTSLHRQILGSDRAIAVSLDHPKRDWPVHLLHLSAALQAAGIPVRHDTGAHPPPSAPPIAHFDATQARRTKASLRSTKGSRTEALRRRPSERTHLSERVIALVCEQTGYPRELVDLHVDMEADLGIDSIKKARLFGELHELFQLPSPSDLRLADFATLEDVVELLSQQGLARGDHAEEGDTPDDGDGGTQTARHRLSDRIIELVCEQTGYPRELVDLHVDIEADLGIDSIKKARLFGELHERFQLPSPADLRLADYSTLDDIVTLLYKTHLSAVGDAGPPRVGEGADNPPFSRYTMSLIARPDRADRRVLTGSALVLGRNAIAEALVAELPKVGIGEALTFDVPKDETESAALERAVRDHPVNHLFLVTPHDRAAAVAPGYTGWSERLGRAVFGAFDLCRAWAKGVTERDAWPSATLTVATALGGDFGLSGAVSRPEGGGLSGLAKALAREFTGLRVAVVDFPPETSPHEVAGHLIAEATSADTVVEVAYPAGVRSELAAVRRPLPLGPPPVHDASHVWLVTGGGRGIGAVAAAAVGRTFGGTVHVLGRTAPGTGRSAGHLSTGAAGVGDGQSSVVHHLCDVSDRDQLNRTLADVRSSSGPITGVIHAAGTEAAGALVSKDPRRVAECVMTKVDGCAALIELLRDDPLRYFVAFGSVSGRFGGLGQADYSLASEMLAKVVQQARAVRPNCKWVTFHWPAWDEVGMSVRPESRFYLEASGRRLMPPLTGVAHLIAELSAPAGDGEVLILDGGDLVVDLPRRSIPSEPREVTSSRPPTAALNDGLADPPTARPASAAGSLGPLLTRLRVDPESAAGDLALHPRSDEFLSDHRFEGSPMLPLAVGLEALAEIAAPLTNVPLGPITFRNVVVHSGIRFFEEEEQTLQATSHRVDEAVFCQVTQDLLARSGAILKRGRECLSALISSTPSAQPLFVPADAHIAWRSFVYPDAQTAKLQRKVFHGPSLRCLKEVATNESMAWGRITAPPPTGLMGRWVPTAVLDACLVLCTEFCDVTLRLRQLPVGFAELTVLGHPRPREQCMAVVRYLGREAEAGVIRFHLDLVASDGRVLVTGRDHSRRILLE